MLESIVSILPSDWFSLSRWPRFVTSAGDRPMSIYFLEFFELLNDTSKTRA